MQGEVTVEVLLDSSMTELVMNLEATKKQEFKLNKMDKPIYEFFQQERTF